jgi:hypothetical protein
LLRERLPPLADSRERPGEPLLCGAALLEALLLRLPEPLWQEYRATLEPARQTNGGVASGDPWFDAQEAALWGQGG